MYTLYNNLKQNNDILQLKTYLWYLFSYLILTYVHGTDKTYPAFCWDKNTT